eukprot:gnl/TRDRNA2_/TRDRNA2_142265_c1_seq1.p1 gnl/TRDRNA2_/TRDRNA2_142265_c1~~gnl/TRDRNA2_/TRDRNA2_142265_c1_seq1.p1  ORF type:complete len:184 (+),score=13.40 gnl/TRDRNA2_/TRDRNA2_142265_c1_seq1:446-997(+)
MPSSIPSTTCAGSCVANNESETISVANSLRLIGILAQQYPYAKFVFNTRDMNAWLAGRVYHCWRWINPKTAWSDWLIQWEKCCGARHGGGGNTACWQEGQPLSLPAAEGWDRASWAFHACCKPLPAYRWVWHAMHEGVKQLFATASDRLFIFNIDQADVRGLSEFIGVEYKSSAWRRSHVSGT